MIHKCKHTGDKDKKILKSRHLPIFKWLNCEIKDNTVVIAGCFFLCFELSWTIFMWCY